MRDKNPEKSDVIERDKSWNANMLNARVGFCNRFGLVSEQIQQPEAVYPLGSIVEREAAHLNGRPESTGGQQTPAQTFWNWQNNRIGRALSVPGYMVFEFDPIFASSSLDDRTGIQNIFVQLQQKIRVYDNSADSWQPGDGQAIMCMNMNINMHVANIVRALKCFKACTNSLLNSYIKPEALTAALGWKMDANVIAANLRSWIDIFNLNIVGVLKQVPWFKDIVPGQDRWAALVSEIYKDTSADTRYCQQLLLRPAQFWVGTWTEVEDSKGKVKTYHDRNGTLRSVTTWGIKPFGTRWGNDDYTYAENAFVFTRYLQDVAAQIQEMAYSEDAAYVYRSLNRMIERGNDNVAGYGLEMMGDRWDYMSYDDIGSAPMFPLTWDFNMMLALHNASILKIDNSEGATVQPSTGILEQHWHLTEGDWSGELAYAAKIVNLPCFDPTNADIASATQWTICFSPEINQPFTAALGMHGEVGTDVITAVRVYMYTVDPADPRSAREISSFEYTQFYTQSATSAQTQLPDNLDPEDMKLSMIFRECFSFAPMTYILNYESAVTYNNKSIEFVATNHDVMFCASGPVLAKIHNMFVNNFWGYPVEVGTPGTADFKAHDVK